MEKLVIEHVHKDLEELKKNVSIIIHILSEEGKLTEETKARLKRARQTSDSEYMKLD